MASQLGVNVDLTGRAFAAYQQKKKQQQQQHIQLQQEQHLMNQFLCDQDENDENESEESVSVLAESDGPSPRTNNTLSEEPLEEMLINEIKQYRCLWDTKARSYKENPKKIESWKQIAAKLGTSGKHMATTYTIMRKKNYHRVRTGHGKPGKSWNFNISKSRPGKPAKSVSVMESHGKLTFYMSKVFT